MMWQRNTLWHLLVWSIICCYALVISGLPLPVDAFSSSLIEPFGEAAERIAVKDRTKPFPCMNKPCGCLSAKQCFQKCCCHTPAETLAWAQQHNIAPEILHALQRRVGQHPNPTQTQIDSDQNIQKTCCHTNDLQSDAFVKTSCEEAIVNDMCGEDICFEYEYLSSAGEKESSSENLPEPQSQDDKHHTANIEVMSDHSLVINSLLACGGHLSEWSASGLALMPEPVEAVCCGQLFLESLRQHPHFLRGVRFAPPTPPPCIG